MLKFALAGNPNCGKTTYLHEKYYVEILSS